jgi:hypothetical protein
MRTRRDVIERLADEALRRVGRVDGAGEQVERAREVTGDRDDGQRRTARRVRRAVHGADLTIDVRDHATEADRAHGREAETRGDILEVRRLPHVLVDEGGVVREHRVDLHLIGAQGRAAATIDADRLRRLAAADERERRDQDPDAQQWRLHERPPRWNRGTPDDLPGREGSGDGLARSNARASPETV